MCLTPTPQIVAEMMTLRMTHMFHHPRLILMGKEKPLIGDEEMKK
jgi:hypothetical protein